MVGYLGPLIVQTCVRKDSKLEDMSVGTSERRKEGRV